MSNSQNLRQNITDSFNITSMSSNQTVKKQNMAPSKQFKAQRPLTRASTKNISSMAPTSIRLFLLYILLCKLSTSQTYCTGVLEIELVNLQRLDSPPLPAALATRSSAGASLFRVLVCLKEAYAGELDGPCALGSANITLSQSTAAQAPRQTIDDTQLQGQTSATNNRTYQALSKEADQQQQKLHVVDTKNSSRQNQATPPELQSGLERQQQAQVQGSQLTNVVRIPFEFGWPKSFTIILTVDQVNESSDRADVITLTTTSAPNALRAKQQQISVRANQSVDLAPLAPNGTNLLVGDRTVTTGGNHQPTNAFIDRHISTEYEVLPSLETSPNKFWTTRFARGLKTSLLYRFRVYCSPNYHGDGCTTICRPRDDSFGHYNCSSSGQRICLDGWHGHDCDKAKCRSGCNRQHGFCDKPDTCQCRPGWEGPRCDECTKYPGCQNGYCLQPWQCACHRNWGGVLCDQDLNYCSSHEPCANNATCQNVAPGRYKCQCADGHTGVNCEIKLSTLIDLTSSMTQLSAGCALNPCLNGGTCYGFNSQLVEGATSGGAEQNRAITEMSMDTADGGSERIETLSLTSGELANESNSAILTHATGRSYRCLCPAGFTGDYCQWTESISLISSQDLATASMDSSTSGSDYPATPNFTTAFSSLVNGDEEEAAVSSTQVAAIAENGPKLLVPQQGSVIESKGGDLHNIIMAPYSNDAASQTWLGPHSADNNAGAGLAAHHLEMRHLISGVVIASAIGVFCAALMLVWCCLMAFEKGGFRFIQMNIIRHADDDTEAAANNGGGVSSTLRRFQEKIRDSFRRSSSRDIRLKPDSKLGINNSLGPPLPPPSYEESNNNKTIYSRTSSDYQCTITQPEMDLGNKAVPTTTGQQHSDMHINSRCINNNKEIMAGKAYEVPVKHGSNLVRRGELQQRIALKMAPQVRLQAPTLDPALSTRHEISADPIMNCPKHGHLYRKHRQHLMHENYVIGETNYSRQNSAMQISNNCSSSSSSSSSNNNNC